MVKKLDLKKYKISDGAIVSHCEDYVNVKCGVGEWPEIEFLIDENIQAYNSVKFLLKVVEYSNVSLILHNKEGRAIIGAAELLNQREFPNSKWVEVVWKFREKSGWITPPSPNSFDFDNVLSIGFCIKASRAKEKSCFEVKDLVFSKEIQIDESMREDNKLFSEFVSNRKQGSLKNKKAVIWASTKATSKTSMGWTSIDSVVSMLDTYKKYKNANGLIMKMEDNDNRKPVFVDSFFNPVELDTTVIDSAIELYKKTDWGNFTDNFFLMTICGIHAPQFRVNGRQNTLDWFDDDLFYNYVYPKIAYFCRALKSIGAHICFDNEAYDTEPYDYYYNYKNKGRSFTEYEQKVRQRGREFAETVCANYPKAKVMMLYGPWVVKISNREEDRYGLLPAFYDGLCEAETDLTFIDACESGYEFTSRISILRGLYDSKNCYKKSKYPKEYQKKIKTDFGIWVRPNVLSKDAFSDLLVNSLRECNEYVWIYTENFPLDDEDVFDYVNTATEKFEIEKAKEK